MELFRAALWMEAGCGDGKIQVLNVQATRTGIHCSIIVATAGEFL